LAQLEVEAAMAAAIIDGLLVCGFFRIKDEPGVRHSTPVVDKKTACGRFSDIGFVAGRKRVRRMRRTFCGGLARQHRMGEQLHL
jgi:hypothetical protein